MIDYHVHTYRCQHAEGSMLDYVLHAISKGIKEICFLDHFTKRNGEYVYSMSEAEIPAYIDEVHALRDGYEGQIAIKVGLEIDFNPNEIATIERIIKAYPFDCIGSSVHFVRDRNIVSYRHAQANRAFDLYADYLTNLLAMLEYDYFDMVCHLDVIKKFNPAIAGIDTNLEPSYENIIKKIVGKCLVVELNTSGYNHPINEIYPGPDLTKMLAREGGAITFGSDAHHPDHVGRFFDRAQAIARKAGFEKMTTFNQRAKTYLQLLNSTTA